MQKLIDKFKSLGFQTGMPKTAGIQLPLRWLFWCYDNPLHEGKSSGDDGNMNKRSRFKDKNAKYPGHDQQCCHNKKGKLHGTIFN